MEYVAEEIEKSRKKIGLSQDEICVIMNIGTSKTFRSRMSDSGTFTFDELKAYALYLEEHDFDFTGYAALPMFCSGKQSISNIASELIEKSHNLERNDYTAIESKIVTIPKLSVTASCGGGNHIESIDCFETSGQFIIDADSLKIYAKDLKAIRVDGYSMVPTLLPDSWVLFNGIQDFVGDGLYVLNWRNILMIKLLQINNDGKMRIISSNKDYESYTIDPDDQSVFKIFGKVVKIMF